jgi:hypothetical protein
MAMVAHNQKGNPQKGVTGAKERQTKSLQRFARQEYDESPGDKTAASCDRFCLFGLLFLRYLWIL